MRTKIWMLADWIGFVMIMSSLGLAWSAGPEWLPLAGGDAENAIFAIGLAFAGLAATVSARVEKFFRQRLLSVDLMRSLAEDFRNAALRFDCDGQNAINGGIAERQYTSDQSVNMATRYWLIAETYRIAANEMDAVAEGRLSRDGQLAFRHLTAEFAVRERVRKMSVRE